MEEYPYISPVNIRNTSVSDTVNIYPIKNIDLIEYFLAAENTQYLHLKYLEYYHILEYYFLHETKEKIKKLLTNLFTSVVLRGEILTDEKYYEIGKSFFDYYVHKDDFKEIEQLKGVINEIGYQRIAELCNENNITTAFLSKKKFGQDTTKIDIGEVRKKKKDERFKTNVKQEDAKKFCDALAERIYKIRNHIVHTKKGEYEEIFTPNSKNLKELKEDVSLIRTLSFSLMVSKNF